MVDEAMQNNVKKLRESNAWSIAELARRAGLAAQTVSKMEKGYSTNRISQLKTAKALGRKHEDVFLSPKK